jgi:hypothetical protein
MLARVFSCAVIGLEGVIVEVEVDIGRGLPGMTKAGRLLLSYCLFLRDYSALDVGLYYLIAFKAHEG